ncbi:MAG: hypothetical protein V3V14_08550 [Saprospiraceae bacterium]
MYKYGIHINTFNSYVLIIYRVWVFLEKGGTNLCNILIVRWLACATFFNLAKKGGTVNCNYLIYRLLSVPPFVPPFFETRKKVAQKRVNVNILLIFCATFFKGVTVAIL